MRAYTSEDYADLFFEHLGTLRKYAERTFVSGDVLDDREEADRALRIREYFAAGRMCEFTDQQLVRLLYAELFE